MLTDTASLLQSNAFSSKVDSFVCHITAIDRIEFGYFLKNNLLFLSLSFCFYVGQGSMGCCSFLA